jgi:hypothetical protein
MFFFFSFDEALANFTEFFNVSLMVSESNLFVELKPQDLLLTKALMPTPLREA